jgi:predicted RNase H-like HicB family nuclease
MRFPLAVEIGSNDHAFGVFRDLPSCFSAADTLDEALSNVPDPVSTMRTI